MWDGQFMRNLHKVCKINVGWTVYEKSPQNMQNGGLNHGSHAQQGMVKLLG